jgi:hypothetical protein
MMQLTTTYVNVYELDSLYGGPEEGGWWYDEGTPFLSLKVEQCDRAGDIIDLAVALREQYQDNGNRRSTVYREVSDKPTDYRVLIEDAPAQAWPEERPRYE